MSWQHVTESQNVFTKLAETSLRLRRVALSRHIRHLEAMVQSHAAQLQKQPGGQELLDKTLKLMQDTRQKLGETCG